MLTSATLLERALAAYPSRTAVVDGERRFGYADLDRRSARLANLLLAAGAGPDRPAAALLPNCAEYVEFDVACARAGITRVGISERLSAEEASYILAHADAAVLVTTTALRARQDTMPDSLTETLLVGAEGRPGDYERAIADASPHIAPTAIAPDTPAYILYTSGTTGRPKGATHSQAARAAAALNMLASELGDARRPVMIHAGPLTHGSGSKVLAALSRGGTNVVLRRFEPERFAQAVREEHGTHTFLVPTMISRLLDASSEVAAQARTMRQISFGGSPIRPVLFRRAIDGFGPILTEVYGSCEAPHPITLLDADDYRDDLSDRVLRSAGRVVAGAEIRVVDRDGAPVPEGHVGELQVSAPHLMRGYWRDEAATADAFAGDAYYRTGDLVRRDADGLVTFEDRERDLIITGGLNVYPSEVERVLADHPAVREVAVLGYPDEQWGESVIAYVVPTSGGAVTAEEIIDWTRDRLAGYKKPRRVEFLERLPLGSSNKVLKKQLRDALWAGHARRVA